MTELWGYNCTATPASAANLSSEQIGELCKQVPKWSVSNRDGILKLEATFELANFVEAMAFANSITEIAEQNDHHPALLIQYGSVKVSWWSHSIGGLHHNDFVLAAKTDKAYTNR